MSRSSQQPPGSTGPGDATVGPLKEAARDRIHSAGDDLVALSHRIHAEPELMYEEHRAAAWVAETLEGAGFTVESGACGIETAVVARAGSGPLHVAVCAEYDALPSMGHACGHNIIAASGVGAGMGLAAVAEEAGLTVTVLGTPAEEGGGGKIRMLEAGAFAGIHCAMMIHPAPLDILEPKIIALQRYEIRYRGKAAHASAFPELGVNAADALVVAQTSIGLLRQHLRAGDRVHGIVTHGGDAPNVVPDRTEAVYMVRAQTVSELEDLCPKVLRCFEAGALATGATLEVDDMGLPYTHMLHDPDMVAAFRRNAEALGRTFPDVGDLTERFPASTDMGNVSLAIPSIHPMLGLDSLPAVNHQPEFAAFCATGIADRTMIEGAVALAWTAIDLAADGAVRERLRAGSAARR